MSTLIVGTIVLGGIVYAGYKTYKSKKAGEGCSSCSGCSGCDQSAVYHK